MKFIEDDKFIQFTQELSDKVFGSRVMNGRIECFSCKRTGYDKKYAHNLSEQYASEIEETTVALSTSLNSTGAQTDATTKFGTVSEVTRISKLEELLGSTIPRETSISGNSSISDTTTFTDGTIISPSNNGTDSEQKQKEEKDEENKMLETINLDEIGKVIRARSCSVGSATSGCTDGLMNSLHKTSLGDFQESVTQKLNTDLILTLNQSFPDYDFSSTRPDQFIRLRSSKTAMNRVNDFLSDFVRSQLSNDEVGPEFLPDLWRAVDDVIVLNDCEVYSYAPSSPEEDSYSDTDFYLSALTDGGQAQCSKNALGSFNYFFVNKSLKRIVFFACVQSSLVMESEVADETGYDIYDFE